MDVRRGDIGIVDNGTRNQKTQEPLLGDHTFLVAEDGKLTSTTRTVHLTWGGLYAWDFSHQLAKYICRCPDGALAARALKYAESWLRSTPGKDKGQGRDTYSQPRAKGVMHDIGAGGALEYGVDALRRSLKWHRRMDAPFSTRKGLGCAAWVAACYQAAAFDNPSIEQAAREACWQKLEELRNPKLKEHERAQNVGATAANYREHVNAGAKTPDAMAQALALLKRDKSESDAALLKRLLTDVMTVDARFLGTDGIMRRVQADSGWVVFESKDFGL